MASANEITARLRALPDLTPDAARSFARSVSKEIAGAPARAVVALSLRLTKGAAFYERFVGFELVMRHPGARELVDERVARALAGRLSDWAGVDTFACYVSGPAWREGRITDAAIHRWATSADRWWRRAAVVSTVALNNKARGGRGDAKRTLRLCLATIDDRDDMVVKAVSWALRELAKREPKAVVAFVDTYEGRLAPRVKREVRNKLTTGLKTPKRRKP